MKVTPTRIYELFSGAMLIGIFLLLIALFSDPEKAATGTPKRESESEIFIEKELHWIQEEEALKSKIKEQQTILEDGYGGRTLITENRLIFQNYTPSDKHAIVTMIGSASYVHSYWMGALAMIQSLREVQTRVPNIVVMCRMLQLVPEFALKAFEKLNATVIPIENIPLDELHVDIPGTWEGAFDKLNVWTLDQFEKVLFLDADTLIVQNIDHLLNEPELTAPYTPTNCQCNADFSRSPQYFTLSSGFFVCNPSMERYRQMIELASNPSPDPEDAAQFGGTWHWGDQEMLKVVFTQLSDSWHKLNWEYDLPVGMCACPQRRTRPIYSYHFVCTYPVSKPWSEPFGPLFSTLAPRPECVVELYMLWLRLFSKALNFHTVDELYIRHVPGVLGIGPKNGVLWV